MSGRGRGLGKLGKQCARGHDHRLVPAEAIAYHKWAVQPKYREHNAEIQLRIVFLNAAEVADLVPQQLAAP